MQTQLRSSSAARFAWLSLDPADNQDPRFWFYLVGALRSALPDLGRSEQRMLAFSQGPAVESILTSMVNQVGTRSERVVLVVDDYHLIIEPPIHEGIAFVLEHMPANMQLVLATRADPPLPLSRLRVRNQLLEIRCCPIYHFTWPEINLLINGVMGLGLSSGDLAALDERTEGWAAGVQLAVVLLMDERPSRAEAGQMERV